MPRVILGLLGLAALDLVVAEYARGVAAESFPWFRVLAHLGWAGLGGVVAVAAAAGVAAALAEGGRWPALRTGPTVGLLLGFGALAHAPLWGVAQGQPDAASWFGLAARLARDPTMLLRWLGDPLAAPEGGAHFHLPMVPASYAAAFLLFGEHATTIQGVLLGWSSLLPVAAWAAARSLRPTDPGGAWLAAMGVTTLPLLQVQSGWMLADLPLVVLILGAVALSRPAAPWIHAVLPSLAALLTKVTAGPLLLGVWMSRWPWLAPVGLLLAMVHPPRPEAWALLPTSLLAVAVQLRPAWCVVGVLALRSPDIRRFLLPLLLVGLPAVALYAPIQHVARYALPVLALTVLAGAIAAPRWSVVYALVAATGVLYGGYTPVVLHHQAGTLPEAVGRAYAYDATTLVVYADQPEGSFAAAPLAALVDAYSDLPVLLGGDLEPPPPGATRWWQTYPPLPWHAGEAPAGSVALLCLFGASPERFEATHPEWEPVGEVRGYRASSLTFPRVIWLYRLR